MKKINENNILECAKYLNIYLYLIEKYHFCSINKLLYTSIIVQNICENNFSTRKRNDLLEYYFSKIKNSNCFSYDNILCSMCAFDILVKNNIIDLNKSDIKILNHIEPCKDELLDCVSMKIFFDEIQGLSEKSFLQEVISCV